MTNAMRILLDTNIIIHREAATVVNKDIGVLFNWLDKLHYTKCVHNVTVVEIEKYEDPTVRETFEVKLANYSILKTTAPMSESVGIILEPLDKTQNDRNDSVIINELYSGRVDALITEDKQLHNKAKLLGISDKTYSIDAFLEKVTTENPELSDYKVLSVRKELFGKLDLADEFFDSFKEDYPRYTKWFNKKAEEPVYVCLSEGRPLALLYLKVENKDEDYSNIEPTLPPKKRLKIGSFKVTLNGYRLGERFLKIIFDNAIRLKVEELYVTIFNKRIEQQRLINLLEEYGFYYHGTKSGLGGSELVYVRRFAKAVNLATPKMTYPFFSTKSNAFITPIYPAYHTELFPDSILRTESPMDFIENEPHRNAISKVFISRSIERNITSGDLIIFYRTADRWPAKYNSVITTIGIAESVIDNIQTQADFIKLCRKSSVFTDSQLVQQWNYRPSRPFIVNFLYAYSFPSRINLERLIQIHVIPNVLEPPRGFTPINQKQLTDILVECKVDESVAVN